MNDEFDRIKKAFPNLTDDNARATSSRSNAYNCIAWALGLEDRWLEPSGTDEFPDNFYGVSYPIEVLVSTFQKRGYVMCADDNSEPGFEKVAIYGKDGEWCHAARQLHNGKWTSKLGKGIDIEHELNALSSSAYGTVQVILRRQK